jgi:hypothetical protein
MVGDGSLKKHLIDELDYVLLPKEGWEFLLLKYGTVNGVKVGTCAFFYFIVNLLFEFDSDPFSYFT